MIRAVPAIAAMAGYALAELDAPGAVSLAQNESAFAPSPKALQAGQKALADAALYPDPDWTALRAAIASVHQIPADQILCGAGSMELIGAIIRAFAGPSDTVLGTEFGYLFAATASQQAGASHLRAPEPSLVVSVDLLLAAVTPDTRIVFLCNPGNPSGTRILNADILRLRDGLRDDILLVVDQAYGEFDDQNPADVLGLVTRVSYGRFPKPMRWPRRVSDGGIFRLLLRPRPASFLIPTTSQASVRPWPQRPCRTNRTCRALSGKPQQLRRHSPGALGRRGMRYQIATPTLS